MLWSKDNSYGDLEKDGKKSEFHVVVVDYGVKCNILRCLVDAGCKVIVVFVTVILEEILCHKFDGVFLFNGFGDLVVSGAIVTGKQIGRAHV